MTDKNTANFPGPNAPLDQGGEVIISQPWLQFFLTLLKRTGGNGQPSTDVSALLAQIQAAQAQVDFQSVVMQDPAVQAALQRIAELAAEMLPAPDLRSLGWRLDDLEAQRLDAQPDLRALISRMDELEARLSEQITPSPTPFEQWNAPTLLNSWVNFGAPYNPAGYWKDQFGVVHLRGIIKSGTMTAAAFTLPAGYRPANTEIAAVTSNSAYGAVVTDSSGNVTPQVGSNASVVLDCITFRAAQ